MDPLPTRFELLSAAVVVRVHAAADLPDDDRVLTPAERAWLATQALGPSRRAEWIRGRAAARDALRLAGVAGSPSILPGPDGAPRVPGPAPAPVSLAHEPGWVAAAASGRPGARVAVDLCLVADGDRARRALGALRPPGADPASCWAAVECGLKLRGLDVLALPGAVAGLRPSADSVAVDLPGGPVEARLARFGGVVLAWAAEDPTLRDA